MVFLNLLCRRPRGHAVGKEGVLFFLKKKPVPSAPGKGRRQRGGFLFFLKKTCAECPWQRLSAKRGGYFFLKKRVPRAPGKGRRQRWFFIFKKILCREPRGTTLGKAGNTRAGKVFLGVAERNCQKPSAKATLPERGHILFYFLFPH
jgi:hypothetical protein